MADKIEINENQTVNGKNTTNRINNETERVLQTGEEKRFINEDNNNDEYKDVKNDQKINAENEDNERKASERNMADPVSDYDFSYMSIYPSVNFWKLQFSLAGCKEVVFFVISIIGAMLMGAAFPVFSIVFGDSLSTFGSTDIKNLTKEISSLSVKLVYCGIGMLVGTFMNTFFSILCGEAITSNIKKEYFRVLLRQEQGFYDQRNAFEFSTKVQAQIKVISSGIGSKVGNFVMSLSMFISSYVVGFYINWKLSFILCSVVPFMTLGGYCMIKGLTDAQSESRKYFEEAGGIAEECLYNIKTVASFANISFEKNRFEEKVQESYTKGKYGALVSSLSRAFVFFLIFGSYGLAIGVGAKFIADDKIKYPDAPPDSKDPDLFKVGDILSILFTIVFGSFALGQAAPNLKAMASACEASREFFYIRERIPLIDVSKSVEKPPRDEIHGHINFEKIEFAYPSKLEKTILKDFYLDLKPGTTTAIVGETGSGKSTIVNILERLYEPQQGEITLDGKNIKHLDLEYFRSLIGYVPQEPVLFNSSLRENIIFGREDVTEEEIQEACKKSFVSDFLPLLEKGLGTKVGLKGGKLSGGQKQRVAIARAVLKKPKILILDEATSALDYKAEKYVKKALDEVSKNVTTIIIAHRLSTVRNADKIVVLNNKGKIAETGTHDSLFQSKGLYYLLVKNQETADNQNEADDLNTVKNDEVLLINKKESKNERKISVNTETITFDKKEFIKFEKVKNRNVDEQNKALVFNKTLLEDDELPIDIRKQILDEQEKFKEGQVKHAKNFLWPIICEFPCRLITATFFACVDGCVWPVYGYLLANVIEDLSITDPVKIKKEGAFLAGMFLVIAGVSGVASIFVGNLFSIMGEHLSLRMRQKCYDKYLSFHMGFYDYQENSPGALLTKLATDTIKINGIALSMVSVGVETIVTLILGIAMAFSFSWQLALLCLGFVPFMIMASAFSLKMQMGLAKNDEIKEKDLGNILSECVINTKTLYCFNMQSKVSLIYNNKMNEGGKNYMGNFWAALFTGVSQMLMFIIYAVTFYVGSVLVADEKIKFGNMLRGIFCLLFAAFGLGMVQQYIGDMDEAKKSMVSLNYVLSTKTDIDPDSKEHNILKEEVEKIRDIWFDTEIQEVEQKYNKILDVTKDIEKLSELENAIHSKDNKKVNELIEILEFKEPNKELDPNNFVSSIEFNNVHFCYPTRADTKIFKGLSFKIEQGQQVAFVGFSGSGKSTIIQLLLRFYDVQKGEILVNGVNIKQYNLIELRKMMGIVMQEPVLFKRNVYNNILYGNFDATREEIIKSAKDAMVKDADQITQDSKHALPVSGGEKQRIAIARCMVRNPKIILLDEATSALDKTKEEQVQIALDKLMIGRTSIVIAHRLSTIVNCHKIFFLEHGEIKESGTHNELLEKKDRYYSLYNSGQGKK